MKIHPGAWILWAASAGAIAISTTNPFYLVLLVAVSWVVSSSHRTQGPWARSFAYFLAFGLAAMAIRTLLVFLGPLSSGGFVYALLEGMRVAVLLVVFGTFNSVVNPFGLLRLAPRRFHEPALAVALALSIAPRTMTAAARVRDAQRLRGIRVNRWRALPALAVPVLETGMEEAVVLAESMDARGHGSQRRTHYRRDRWGLAAWTVASASAIALACFVAATALGSSLAMQTFPLQWPEVSWALVGAILLLASPSLVAGDH